jgi:multidrug efflux pump subunit AcrA (membrane-fusion protein)
MRFLTRSLSALLLAALTLALLAWAAQIVISALETRAADAAAPRPERERVFAVNVITATPAPETPVITAFGEVRAAATLELRAPVGGRVVMLDPAFVEGGRVAAGAVLMEIDPADAEAEVALARADLSEAEASLRDAGRRLELARAEVAQAEAQRALQIRALERQQALGDRGVGTSAAREAAELALSSAEQAILSRRQAEAQAETALDAAGTLLERRRIALEVARRELGDRVLRAEFAGLLSDVSIRRGGLVSVNERLGELVDPTALEVAFRLSTAQHARLAAGGIEGAAVRAVLDVEGLDLEARGRITREAPATGEGQTGRLVFAELSGARGFRPGDFVRVEVEEPPLAQAIRLPATALSAAGDVLLVTQDERLEAVPVRLLRRQGDDVLVEGAIAGREVVAERAPALGAGIKVRPVRPRADGAADAPPAREMISLDPERRARLVAFVEGNRRMPAEMRERLIAQLSAEEVPAATVARIEGRMGG